MKNENIVCVPFAVMSRHFDMGKTHWVTSRDQIDALEHLFLFRPDAERDFTHKQLIPYAIVQNDNDEILCYQRAGSEKRLSGIWSAGIGGHVNDIDKLPSLYDTLCNGLIREFQEEVGVELELSDIKLAGMINEEFSEVGHCHTGVVFSVNIHQRVLSFDAEVSNPTWMKVFDIDYSKFELWSSLAIQLITGHE